MICYIVGAMENHININPSEQDLVIAADGGYRYLNGIKPDYVVGDFDSLGYVPEEERVFRHPEQKDDTDMMLAVKLGLGEGYREFILLGGIGGRLDHTLANIQTLAYLDSHDAHGVLLSENQQIYFLHNKTLRFSEKSEGLVSVFAYSENAKGVWLNNLLYELNDAILTTDFPLGVSNAFTGKKAEICVKEGSIFVVCEHSIIEDEWK